MLCQIMLLICLECSGVLPPHNSNNNQGTSLAVQWLRLLTPHAGALDSIPGQWTKIPHATWARKKKKRQTWHKHTHAQTVHRGPQALSHVPWLFLCAHVLSSFWSTPTLQLRCSSFFWNILSWFSPLGVRVMSKWLFKYLQHKLDP